MTAKICMIGDIVAQTGIDALKKALPALQAKEKFDLVVVNGENAANGNGILPENAEEIFAAGVDIITGGNHTFEKRDVFPYLCENKARILRPQNFPDSINPIAERFFREKACDESQSLPNRPPVPGAGFAKIEKNGFKFAVLNLQGRQMMNAIDCPFAAAEKAAAELQDCILLVDFHAESNAEKEAMGFFLDGRAAVVAGTHTHVQTADERILPRGTAFIADLGMTGAQNSVIGSDVAVSIRRSLTQILFRLDPANEEPAVCGIIVEIDSDTKKARSISRIKIDAN